MMIKPLKWFATVQQQEASNPRSNQHYKPFEITDKITEFPEKD